MVKKGVRNKIAKASAIYIPCTYQFLTLDPYLGNLDPLPNIEPAITLMVLHKIYSLSKEVSRSKERKEIMIRKLKQQQ